MDRNGWRSLVDACNGLNGLYSNKKKNNNKKLVKSYYLSQFFKTHSGAYLLFTIQASAINQYHKSVVSFNSY